MTAIITALTDNVRDLRTLLQRGVSSAPSEAVDAFFAAALGTHNAQPVGADHLCSLLQEPVRAGSFVVEYAGHARQVEAMPALGRSEYVSAPHAEQDVPGF